MDSQQFMFCTNDKEVFHSIHMNVRTICINHVLCKDRVLEWCDTFSSLLETYSLQENIYIKNIRSRGNHVTNSHLVFRKDPMEFNLETQEDLVVAEDKDKDKDKATIFENLQCFNNNNHYFKNLLYDSVTMSYHPNIHKRKLIHF